MLLTGGLCHWKMKRSYLFSVSRSVSIARCCGGSICTKNNYLKVLFEEPTFSLQDENPGYSTRPEMVFPFPLNNVIVKPWRMEAHIFDPTKILETRQLTSGPRTKDLEKIVDEFGIADTGSPSKTLKNKRSTVWYNK